MVKNKLIIIKITTDISQREADIEIPKELKQWFKDRLLEVEINECNPLFKDRLLEAFWKFQS